MNLILLERGEIADDGTVTLEGRRAQHIATVIRPEDGDTLRVGVIDEGRGQASVISVDDDRCVLRVGLLAEDMPRPSTELVLAVPRPKVLPRVLAAAASLGVSRITLTNAWRVDKSYFGSPSLAASAIQSAVRLGCEQGALTTLPQVTIYRRFMLWLESLADASHASADTERRIVAHPRADRGLASFTPFADRPVKLCIGPEGGWIEAELKSLEDASFGFATISASVLRVETAIAVALGQLELLRSL